MISNDPLYIYPIVSYESLLILPIADLQGPWTPASTVSWFRDESSSAYGCGSKPGTLS